MGNCIATIMSQVLHFSEKFSMWIAASTVVTCIILCLFSMLAFGIGLGWNYSYVDYRSKHVYVPGQYKKVQPTNYFGPGYFKPTLKPARRASEKSEVIEVVREYPENLPSGNPTELVKKELALPVLPTKRTDQEGPPFQRLYFDVADAQSATKNNFVRNFRNYFKASTSGVSNKNETEVKADISDKSSIEFGHMNTSTTGNSSGLEEIRVDVDVDAQDVDNSSVSNTMMNLNQLMSFLSKLQDEKKTFSVHVIAL